MEDIRPRAFAAPPLRGPLLLARLKDTRAARNRLFLSCLDFRDSRTTDKLDSQNILFDGAENELWMTRLKLRNFE